MEKCIIALKHRRFCGVALLWRGESNYYNTATATALIHFFWVIIRTSLILLGRATGKNNNNYVSLWHLL